MYSFTRVQGRIRDFLPFAYSTNPHLKTILVLIFDKPPFENFIENGALPCRRLYEELGLDIDIDQINDNLSPGLWTGH